MAACHPFGAGPFGEGAFGGCLAPVIHGDCGFGLEPFGWGPFGVGCVNKFTVNDLQVVSGYDGPQLVLSWTAPEKQTDKLSIYRRKGSQPESPTDPKAELVYQEVGIPSLGMFADTPVNSLKLGSELTVGWWHYRVFTDIPAFNGLFDRGGGSDGFDFAYDKDAFDTFVWEDLVPDSWGLLDMSTSQRVPALYTHTTDERINVAPAKDKQGFAQRFISIFSLMLRRLDAYMQENVYAWDAMEFRADALRRLAMIVGVDVSDEHYYDYWRRDVRDAWERNRNKGRKNFLEVVGEQESLLNVSNSVEMHTRVHYAWNPQEPDGVDPGLIIGAEALQIETNLDTSTYAWNPAVTSPYNERGWRLYFSDVLTYQDRQHLVAELQRLKPATVTVEIWENNQMTAQVT